jgi:sec-independent protein translocase protein TatA
VFNIGPMELIVILLLALIVFGPKRLPEIGRTVGKGLREFQKATRDIRGEIEGAMTEEPGSGSTSAYRRPGEPKPSSGPEQNGGERPAAGET